MTREAILQAADAAWEKYSQPMQLPAGAVSYVAPCRLMAQIGFKLALIDALEKLMQTDPAPEPKP